MNLRLKFLLIRFCFLIADILFLPFFFILALLSRFLKKKIDIGIGPIPLINNQYHKKSLEMYGYKAETFVDSTWFITKDFDIIMSNYLKGIFRFFTPYFLFLICITRYKALYIYFVGGPLRTSTLLRNLEPIFLKIANIKTVLLAYGADVHNFTATNNYAFKDATSIDYPHFKFFQLSNIRAIERWTNWGDFIFSGCDWIEYLYHWDELMISHFAIDCEKLKPKSFSNKKSNTLKILHAPNHRATKGTDFIIKSINKLKKDGYKIDLKIVENKSNQDVIKAIMEADIVIDQIIVGWYAMFAIEAMALEKPVICYLREDFLDLYEYKGLIKKNEFPIINCNFKNLEKN